MNTSMERLQSRVWCLRDRDDCAAYLAVGDQKAMMIDTGMGAEPLMPLVRKITPLPAELLLTHAHGDHYGAAGEFGRVWLHERDLAILGDLEEVLLPRIPVPGLRRETLVPFGDSAVFDLGGECVHVLPLPGHTPGSCVFALENEPAVFCGDAIGSGNIVLMALPFALGLREYRAGLAAFIRQAGAYGGFEWLGGHCGQAGEPGKPGYNPPRLQVAQDMLALCDRLLAGTLIGEPVWEPMRPQGDALRAYHGTAGMVYLPRQLG